MYCKNCGTDNNESSKFCRVCGAPMNNDGEAQGYGNYSPEIGDYTHGGEVNITDNNKPISMWGYFGYQILFSIPLVGFICLIIFAVSARNKNLKNFAASYFCVFILLVAIILVLAVLSVAGVISSIDITDLI